MNKMRVLVSVFLISLCLTAFPQSSIDDIIMNPGKYNNESVSISGTVTQYVAGTTVTTSYYLIKSDFGAVIRVNTSSPKPEVNYKYEVEGTIVVEPAGPIVIEKNKICLNCPPLPPPPPPNIFIKYWWLFAIIGVLVIAIIILVIVFIVNSNKRKRQGDYDIPPVPGPIPAPEPSVTIPGPPPPSEITYDKTLTSVKVPDLSAGTGTLKYIPMGKLMIQSGHDAGKTITLSGFQTNEGIVLSIGRDVPEWKDYLLNNKKYSANRLLSHILIPDETNTLSRLQAELIYKNDQLYIKHIGGNPTVVDGDPMSKDEMRKLSLGSIIQAGAMEFKYVA